LRRGDLVALVSPANAIRESHDPNRLNAVVTAIEDCGLRVKVMSNALNRTEDGRGGTLEQRVSDLNDAFADPEVRLIQGTVGGAGTLEVVSSGKLDWDALRRHPKLICGFSDLCFLVIAAHLRLDMVTLDGPLAVAHWGCLPKPPEYGTRALLRVAGGKDVPFVQRAPEKVSINPFEFSSAEDRDERFLPAEGWKWLRKGRAQGRLLAIRADQIIKLSRVGINVSLKGRIWCVEGLPEPDKDRNYMLQVRDQGFLRGVVGLVSARPFALPGRGPRARGPLEQTLLNIDLSVPILTNVDFGHTIPRMTIPNGVLATLDSERDRFSFDERATA
jgi:muramoyltetrapeptide carboxypeptidase LdcA involved in peptidoglycan recycling